MKKIDKLIINSPYFEPVEVSVPDFVVSLPSVLVSRQTTLRQAQCIALRLTNTSERYLSVLGTYTLWKNALVVVSLL